MDYNFHTRNILIHKKSCTFWTCLWSMLTMSLTITPWSNMFCLTKKRKALNVLSLHELNRKNTCLPFMCDYLQHTPSCELFHYNAMSNYIIYKYKCNSFQDSQYKFSKFKTTETKNTIPKMWIYFHIILYSRFNKHGTNKLSGLNSFL